MLFRSSVRADRARPVRGATASRRRTTAARRRSLTGDRGPLCLLHDALFVGLLDVAVAPIDDGLRAKLDEVFLELVTAFVREDAIADLIEENWRML